jgi:RimJ/RimL family protein N-acetyltransferase
LKKILKNGQEILIRKADKGDSAKIIEHMYFIGGESDNLTFGGNEWDMPLEKEEQFIEAINKKDNSIMIIALLNDEIVGITSFRGEERNRLRHTGEFGLTVRKPYWNLGIGGILLGFLIEWAKDTGIIRKIDLLVRIDNENAIKLYEKYGFKQEGIIKRHFLIVDKFYDSQQMGLLID